VVQPRRSLGLYVLDVHSSCLQPFLLSSPLSPKGLPPPLARQQCCRCFCGSRPMASVEELVAKANQLRRLRQEAGQKSRELKRQAMAVDAGQAVTPWGAKRVAMRVFALSGFNLAASTKYLRHKGRWSDDTGCRTWYHALPTESRAQLLHPAEGDGVARRQLAEARTFVEEEQLVAWIQLQNQAKGIAPTPGAVLGQGPVPPSWGGSLNSQRRRLRRLVARRGGRKAVFGGNEQLEPAVLERKARRSHSSCPCASPCVICGPDMGPAGRLGFLALRLRTESAGHRNASRHAVPFPRPQA